MKDTSVPWLGQVPKHWQPMRFAYLVEFRKGLSITKADLRDSGIPCVSYGEVHSKYGFEVNPERHALKCVEERFLSESPRSLLANGDFVFADTSEDVAGSGNFTYLNSESRIFAGYHTIIARPTMPIHHRYLAYQLDTKAYRAQIQSQVSGVKVFSITKEILRNLVLYLPPIDEQRAIATFLDHKTAQIDSLIDKKRRMIELLKEKRAALISHAVTKGLNPVAPMKDSGVPWLGQVPSHWEVKKVKHITAKEKYAFVDGPFGSNLKSEHFITDGDVYVVESGFVTSGEYVGKEFKTISREHFETIRRSECRGSDIIIAKIGAYYGMSGILPALDKPAVVSGNSLKLTCDRSKIEVEFLHLMLLHLKYCGSMRLIVNETAQPALSLGGLKNIEIVVPPIDEQQNILHEYHESKSLLDAAIARIGKAVEKLNEYRTSIITAAVTGQIEVRNYGAA